MAEFIPDRLPKRATRGEERTFSILKKLPDNYLVYYEPHIENRHPDFIVIAPDLGIMVIEVKGWYLENILQASDSEVTVDYDGHQKCEAHPLTQARNYLFRLMKACEQNPRYSQLLHKEGPLKNRFLFPFAHFVILANITQDQLSKKKDADLSQVFRPKNTITRDIMLALEDASGEEIAKTLREYFDPFWEIEPMTSEQINILRAVIHPQIVLDYFTSTKPHVVAEPEPTSLKVLDRRQENNSRKIGEGHRILCGIAGSGKTVLLTARARLLHDQDPEARILLLCYNYSLAMYLKRVLVGYPRITVTHFDGWAKMNGIPRIMLDLSTGKVEDDASLGDRFFDHLQSGKGDYRHFDSILIDEAQDFPQIWFSCVLMALKDQYDGDLLIVCDGNQGIRPIDAVSWKSIGIRARGRTIHRALDLDKNYRNTQEILALASHFALNDVKESEDTIGIIPVKPNQAVRNGERPLLVHCTDHADECRNAIRIVKGLLGVTLPDGKTGTRLKPEEIGILYRKASAEDKQLLHSFVEEVSQFAPIHWVNESYHSRQKVVEDGVKIQTVDSAKGLQYRAVIILWPDAFVPFRSADQEQENRRFYVALTRAEDMLVITYSKPNEIVDKLLPLDTLVKA